MRRAALAAAIILLTGPSVAAATDVSRGELADLADRAGSDKAALAELRQVTSVDGAPADLAAALQGADGQALQGRLENISSSAEAAPPGSIDAVEARARAEEILANDQLEPPAPASGDGSAELPSVSPGLAIVLALAVVLLAGAVARGLGRQTVIEREAASRPAGESVPRWRELDRAADEAERRGEFVAAVRLRFRAGLNRLDEAGSIRLRPSLTAAGAARESGLERVGALARSYEQVAFGGRGASAAEAEEQRQGWRSVIDDARRR